MEKENTMFKMEIVLDETKMNKSGYDTTEVYSHLDDIFESLNTKKTGKGKFEGKGTPDDFGIFGGAILLLKRQEWFIPFVQTWLWHTDTGIEDLVSYYRKKGVIHVG